jgi:F-type H+-transporting ATPase subunit epsilon
MATFTLEVATPEKLVVSNEVSEAVLPGANGEIGVLPGHAALITEVSPGSLTYSMDGQRHSILVTQGWAEVGEDRVRVLVDACESLDKIDVARAEVALKRANERLASVNQEVDMARALNAARRAQARLDAARAK